MESIWGKFPNGNECRIPILCVAGGKSSGKTWLMSTIDPASTVMIDLEDSSATYSFPFLARHSLYEHLAGEKNPTPLMIFEWTKKIMESIPAEAKVVVIDPASDFTQGLFDYIMANASQFGISSGQSEKMSGLVWGKAKAYVKSLIGAMSQRGNVETVCLSFHIGKEWSGGAPTSREKAKGPDVFYELASLYLWLGRDDNEAIPWGVTVPPKGKNRLAVPVEKDGEWIGVPCLPPKIAKCTVAAIRKYIANPPDWSKLKASEKYTEPELNEEQKLEMQAQIAHAQLEAEKLKNERMEKTAKAYAKDAVATPAVKEQAKPLPATETIQQPSETQTPPFDTPDTPVDAVTMASQEQLMELKRLKDQLGVPAEAWKSALEKKFGVQSATQLNIDQAKQLNVYLMGKLEEKQSKDQVSQWAEGALAR